MQRVEATAARSLHNFHWNQDYADVAMGLALAILALSTAARDHRLDPLSVSLLLLQTLPIAIRRRNPMRILFITGSAITVYSLAGYLGANGVGDSNGAYGVVVAFYTVAANEPRRRAIVAAGMTAVCVLISFAAYAAFDSISGWTANLSVTYLSFGLAWLIGDNLRVRRAYTRQLEDRALELEREREEKAAQAVTEERARIARELHDVVELTGDPGAFFGHGLGGFLLALALELQSPVFELSRVGAANPQVVADEPGQAEREVRNAQVRGPAGDRIECRVCGETDQDTDGRHTGRDDRSAPGFVGRHCVKSDDYAIGPIRVPDTVCAEVASQAIHGDRRSCDEQDPHWVAAPNCDWECLKEQERNAQGIETVIAGGRRERQDGQGQAHRYVGIVLVPVEVVEAARGGRLDSLHARKLRRECLSCIGLAQDHTCTDWMNGGPWNSGCAVAARPLAAGDPGPAGALLAGPMNVRDR